MSDADIEALAQSLTETVTIDDEFSGVWPDNVAIVAAFLAASTQWRMVSVGGGLAPSKLFALGLDYAGARIGIEVAGIEITPDLWRGVTIMEREVLKVFNETGG